MNEKVSIDTHECLPVAFAVRLPHVHLTGHAHHHGYTKNKKTKICNI